MSFLRMNCNSKLAGAPKREYVGAGAGARVTAHMKNSSAHPKTRSYNDTASKIQPNFFYLFTLKNDFTATISKEVKILACH